MKFEILIGMIASGKSTYCLKRVKEGAIIINDDSIVNALHANDYPSYKKSLKPLYKGIEHYVINFAGMAGIDVVIDRPNLNANTRKRYIEIAKSIDIENIEGVIFKIETPEVHAERRVKSDNRGWEYEYWLRAAQHQYSLYNEPQLNEGFTKLVKYEDL